MKCKYLLLVAFVITSLNPLFAQTKKYSIHTVAFYNFENLFDTINGPNYDEEWLPNGPQNWTSKKYQKKFEFFYQVGPWLEAGNNKKGKGWGLGGAR